MDFLLGHAPTTQIGILGDCTGGGNSIITMIGPRCFREKDYGLSEALSARNFSIPTGRGSLPSSC
jgi:hypothetical protein